MLVQTTIWNGTFVIDVYGHLRSHLKMHSGEMPFSSFPQKNHLNLGQGLSLNKDQNLMNIFRNCTHRLQLWSSFWETSEDAHAKRAWINLVRNLGLGGKIGTVRYIWWQHFQRKSINFQEKRNIVFRNWYFFGNIFLCAALEGCICKVFLHCRVAEVAVLAETAKYPWMLARSARLQIFATKNTVFYRIYSPLNLRFQGGIYSKMVSEG